MPLLKNDLMMQALVDLESQSILTEEHLMLDKTLTEVKKVMN